jgi:MoxR-like ATPase
LTDTAVVADGKAEIDPITEQVVEGGVVVPKFDLETVPERYRQQLSDMIPNPLLAKRYVHRKMDGVLDFTYLDYAILDRENVALFGPTGSAKTTFFRAYAAARGYPICIVTCNASMDLTTILGRTNGIDSESGLIDYTYGEMSLVVAYGGILLIDEINMMHARIATGFNDLLSVMRSMSLPENNQTLKAGRMGLGAQQPFLPGACWNPRYEGTVRLNFALTNRFPQAHEWGYDREVEGKLLKGGKSSKLLALAWRIRAMEEIRSPTATNMLMEFERHVGRFGIHAAETMFKNHYQPEERGAIGRVLEAERSNIENQLFAPA